MDLVPTSAGHRHRHPLIGCFQGCLILLVTIALSLLLIGGTGALFVQFSPFSAFSSMPVGTAVEEVALFAKIDV